MSFDVVLPAFKAIKTGFSLTLLVTITSFAIGQLLALPIGLGLTSSNKWLRFLSSTYTFVVRGSPLLVQIFILYYGLGQVEFVRLSPAWPILRSALYCAIIAISLNSAAYMAEVIAGALRSLPKGRWEAADTLALSRGVRLRKIVLPQIYRAILPAIGNEIILVMKASTLASAITVMEMTGAARVFVARAYSPFEPFLIAGGYLSDPWCNLRQGYGAA
jgi:octopine/nopaline transport system permease protein